MTSVIFTIKTLCFILEFALFPHASAQRGAWSTSLDQVAAEALALHEFKREAVTLYKLTACWISKLMQKEKQAKVERKCT